MIEEVPLELHEYEKPTSILLVANSTPMVDFDSKLNSFLVNRDSRLLLPTPESPISTTEREKGKGKTTIKHVFLLFEVVWLEWMIVQSLV